MKNTQLKYAKVYTDYSNTQPYYVRIVLHESVRFPHGVATGESFIQKSDADEYAKQVDKYFREFFE
jgi:hypothetical protein